MGLEVGGLEGEVEVLEEENVVRVMRAVTVNILPLV